MYMRHYVGCGAAPTVCTTASCKLPTLTTLVIPAQSDQATPTAEINAQDNSNNNVLGSSDGFITFKFVAGANFPKYGGQLVLGLPNWYGDGTPSVFNNDALVTVCSSNEIVIMEQKLTNSDHIVKFQKYSGTATDTITIKCTNYNNPVYEKTLTGFSLSVFDLESINNNIMSFPDWSLDATTLLPLTLTTDVSFSFEDVIDNNALTQVPIQTIVTILIAFTMPVPVEKSGCYVKYTFPNDF